MKILICGKGGSGKSTISALLAEELASKGHKVLVVDTDESNFGLYKHLGMEQPKDFMESLGGKAGLRQAQGIHKIRRERDAEYDA